VTRDVWNLAGFEDDDRRDLLYVARTSFASLGAPPADGFVPPETPAGDLTAWEQRMVADDILKRSFDRLADYVPTHLILDFIDERFDLLSDGRSVANYSWELHRSGLRHAPPLAGFRQVSRHSEEAGGLWRRGLEVFADFARRRLPGVRLIFHDARWARDYRDAAGAVRPLDPDRVLWEGLPANIGDHNRVLDRYARAVREVLPAAFHVRAPAPAQLADEGHRWGLSPFHYVEAYYRYAWDRFVELGCRR